MLSQRGQSGRRAPRGGDLVCRLSLAPQMAVLWSQQQDSQAELPPLLPIQHMARGVPFQTPTWRGWGAETLIP